MEAMALWHGLGGLATAAGLLLAGAGGMHLLTRQRVRAHLDAHRRQCWTEQDHWLDEHQDRLQALEAERRHVEQALGQQLVQQDRQIGGERAAHRREVEALRCQLLAARAEVVQLLGLLEESDAARARLQARVERLPAVSRSALVPEGRRAGPVRLALRGTGVSGTGADEGDAGLPTDRRRRVVPLPPGMNDRRVGGASTRLRALT
ncbi:MAG: hypothetical protein RL654_508 [Pseudomonadota bacterium]